MLKFQPPKIMSENFAEAKTTPFTEVPSARNAADELRAAAGQDTPKPQSAANAESTPGGSEKVQQMKQTAAEKAQQFRDYAGDKTKNISSVAAEKAAQFKDVAGERGVHLKDVAGEQWEETRVKALEVHASTEDYIRQNPTRAVLTAAGIGLILGLITRR